MLFKLCTILIDFLISTVPCPHIKITLDCLFFKPRARWVRTHDLEIRCYILSRLSYPCNDKIFFNFLCFIKRAIIFYIGRPSAILDSSFQFIVSNRKRTQINKVFGIRFGLLFCPACEGEPRRNASRRMLAAPGGVNTSGD